ANLLIARAASRRSELAIRAALGAGRWRIARQLLSESLLLAMTGGILGLAIAFWLTRAVVGLAPADLKGIDQVGLDGPVLAFTVVAPLIPGVLFGVLPSWIASRRSLADATRDGARGSESRQRLRSTLMAAEIALALVLVAGAGLLLRSFSNLMAQPLGFA